MSAGFPYLSEDTWFPFPSPEEATPEGIVASGGNLSPGMLLSAYRQGIFPWFADEDPILWWSPDPRCVLTTDRLHVSRSMSRILRKEQFRITFDASFPEVVSACAEAPRPGQNGTWITEEMQDAYVRLHRLGFAHSVEAWHEGTLAGGLYGLSLGRCFFGESMFSREPNASKAAFIALVTTLRDREFRLIDCQVANPHLLSLGAEEIPRRDFLDLLRRELDRGPTLRGDWSDFSFRPARV